MIQSTNSHYKILKKYQKIDFQVNWISNTNFSTKAKGFQQNKRNSCLNQTPSQSLG